MEIGNWKFSNGREWTSESNSKLCFSPQWNGVCVYVLCMANSIKSCDLWTFCFDEINVQRLAGNRQSTERNEHRHTEKKKITMKQRKMVSKCNAFLKRWITLCRCTECCKPTSTRREKKMLELESLLIMYVKRLKT